MPSTGTYKYRILLIEDDPNIRNLLQEELQEAGYDVCPAPNGFEGLEQYQHYRPDLVIIDVMMPGINGWQVCAHLRRHSQVPILMITALQGAEHTIRGLEEGADDYLEKPFHLGVFLARVRSLLRRVVLPRPLQDANHYDDGYLQLDLTSHRVMIQGQPVHLSPLEYTLLAYLFRHAGRIVTHEQILQHLWQWEAERGVENLHLIVTRLRKKIEMHPGNPEYLLTERRFGYRFQKRKPD